MPAGVSHVVGVNKHQRAWTPGRIASASVLAVAVGALILDKALLGHAAPSEAAAAEAIASASSNERIPAAAQPESLAHRLEGYRAQADAQADDAFKAPEGFFPARIAPAPEDAPTQKVGEAVVQPAWPRVSAVVTGSIPGAILNGRLQKVGETVDGFTLVSVAERSVVVRQGELEVVVEIDDAHR